MNKFTLSSVIIPFLYISFCLPAFLPAFLLSCLSVCNYIFYFCLAQKKSCAPSTTFTTFFLSSHPDISLLWFLTPFKAIKHLVCNQYKWPKLSASKMVFLILEGNFGGIQLFSPSVFLPLMDTVNKRNDSACHILECAFSLYVFLFQTKHLWSSAGLNAGLNGVSLFAVHWLCFCVPPAAQMLLSSGSSSPSKLQNTWCVTSTGGWPSRSSLLSCCWPSWLCSFTTCLVTWWRRCWVPEVSGFSEDTFEL